LLVLKQILNNLLLAVGSVPAPKFDNLAEWDRIAPPITQAAEGVSMALRERNPVLASILPEIAAKCGAMRAKARRQPSALGIENSRFRNGKHIERAIRELAESES
jgi:hypothetical protein